jgi:hypothetical protein
MFDLIGKIYTAGFFAFFFAMGIHLLKQDPAPMGWGQLVIFACSLIAGIFWPVIVGGWIL